MIKCILQHILPVNERTINGRVYPEDVVISAFQKVKEVPIKLQFSEEIIGKAANFRYDSLGHAACDGNIIDRMMPILDKAREHGKVTFNLCGWGEVDDAGFVSEYHPNCVEVNIEWRPNE